MHYLLFYDLAADYLTRRQQYRREHLTLTWKSHAAGELILGGALADPVDQAVLLFQVESKEVINRFIEADPYVRNGLVSKWTIREWTTVVGDGAGTPVRP